MPPKRNSTSKKSGKPNLQTLINGRTKEETTKEQIEEYIAHLQEELDREMEERNYFQLERDQVHTFGKITAKKLEEVLAEEKILEKGLEEDEEHHLIEIKVYKQKIKHLLCEHQSTISELKEEGLVSIKKLQKELDELKMEFHKKIKAGMVDIQELNNDDFERQRLLLQDEVTKTRNNWEQQVTETAAKYEECLKLFQEELENTETSLVMNCELERDTHIVAFQEEMREVFNSIQEVNILMEQNREIMNEIQNKILQEKEIQVYDIPKVQKNNIKKKADFNLKNKVIDMLILLFFKYQCDLLKCIQINVHKNSNKKWKVSFCYFSPQQSIKMPEKKTVEDLKLENEALEQKFNGLQLEKAKLYNSVTPNIERTREKVGLRSAQLRRKLQDLTDSLANSQTQLFTVLSDPNMDHNVLSEIANKSEENLDRRKSAIRNIAYKKNEILKARSHLLLTGEENQMFKSHRLDSVRSLI
uniref:Dynein regulatory complex subunit 4 n=1 Tax=Oryzias latipes TaxID=8090 RepID=A0A3P9KCZ3_ORYLA